jgi:hypothetical protein
MALLNEIQLVNFTKILDARGNLSVIEQQKDMPFDIKRVYWIYDVPGGEQRGGHAFYEQHELIVAMSGSFDVVINNGRQQTSFHLNRSYKGLYVPNLTWRHLENFSTNSLALIVTNTQYAASDYIRDFDEYLRKVT